MQSIGTSEQRCGILVVGEPEAAKLLTSVLSQQDVYQVCDSKAGPSYDDLYMQGAQVLLHVSKWNLKFNEKWRRIRFCK